MRKPVLVLSFALALVAGCSSGSGGIRRTNDFLDELMAYFSLDGFLGANAWSFSPGMLSMNSANGVPDKRPDEDGTDIIRAGLVGRYLTADDLSRFDSDFPEGQGSNGFTVYGDSSQPLVPGYYYFPFIETVGDIPVTDNGRFYQWGAVFDRDNDESNNFTNSSFPKDTFTNTDTWFQLLNAQGNLSLTFTDALGGSIQQIPTNARALISGNALTFMFHADDLNISLPCYDPCYRMTAFCHGGDFGFNPPHDWSGSARPRQDLPLAKLSTEGLINVTPRVELTVNYLGVEAAFADSLARNLSYSFVDEPFEGNGFSNGHGESIAAFSDLVGGKDGGLNVVPRDSTKGTLFPCLRSTLTAPTQTGAFVSFPVVGELNLSPANYWMAPSRFDNGLGTSVAQETSPEDPVELFGTVMNDSDVATLIAQAENDPNTVNFQKVFDVHDGQIANSVLKNELVDIAQLRLDVRNLIESYEPTATQARVAIPLHVYPHASTDLSDVTIDLRLTSKTVILEDSTPITIDNNDYRSFVPFTQTGRLKGLIPIPNAMTVVLSGHRFSGDSSTRSGIPLLSDVPVLSGFFSSNAEIPSTRTLLILVRARIIVDPLE
ncbi:MAG: type II and III secretion system protein [Planctomycetota bacterium]|nr:type II and III secretion system protein [Planctomycetota bacterium]